MATEVSSSARIIQPYSCTGLVCVTFPDGSQFTGTCTLVGRNDILTATHVVYSPDNGGWAKGLDFYFGADYSQAANRFDDYGYVYSPTKWTISAWPDQVFTDTNNKTLTQGESQFDIAVIGVNTSIGDNLGWLGIDPGYNTTVVATAVGYPAGTDGMMQETTTVNESAQYYLYEATHEVMGPGSSGGPLLIGNYVIGVKSTGRWWADVDVVFNKLTDEMDENNYLLSSISGTDGNDILKGASGNETLIGGAGIDTVIFTGNRSQYVLTQTAGGYQVQDNMAGRDGTDTISNVETLKFADCTVDLTMRHQATSISTNDLKVLEELYVGFFNRIPEAAGLSYWIDAVKNGASLTSVADQFYNAGVQYGDYSATMSESDFIKTIYTNVLGRSGASAPDSSEIGYWQTWLHSGTNGKGGMVLDMINVSHQQYTNDPKVGWVVSLLNNKAMVADYFAVQQGLSYNDAQTNITKGIAIATAITPTDTTAAIALIGVNSFVMSDTLTNS